MKFLNIIFIILFISCNNSVKNNENMDPYIIILGIAQDAGYPQAGCTKSCCKETWENPIKRRMISCIAIVDPASKEQWIIDATPDIKFQLNKLYLHSKINHLDGVFITHAHIGHYTGIINFGKEVIGSNNLPVYVMSRMKDFLKNNAPWDQLINIENIKLMDLDNNSQLNINDRIQVTPFLVPHRDEYSATVGYRINTQNKSCVFIPDIDKWHLWDVSIKDLIKEVDYALLDATFYQNGELGRDMSKIPHPFVKESMDLFEDLSSNNKRKVHFIHLNHTNPLLIKDSDEQKEVREKGFNIAEEGQILTL